MISKHLPREVWDRLRHDAYRRAGCCCQACQSRGPLDCHEMWCFNDRTECQTLLGFEALCEDCHRAKHIFPVHIREEYAKSRRHLAELNGFSADELTRYVQAAFRQYVERSKKPWKVAFGSYAFLVTSLRDKSQRVQFVRKTHSTPATASHATAQAARDDLRPAFLLCQISWRRAGVEQGERGFSTYVGHIEEENRG